MPSPSSASGRGLHRAHDRRCLASSERDALGRVLTAISPDDSEVLYTYDEGGALQTVEVKHRGSSSAQTVGGQRESVVYGATSSRFVFGLR